MVAINGRNMYIFKTFINTWKFSGYIYPQQNGFSFPLSWSTQAYKTKKWKKKEIQRGRRMVPTSPDSPPSASKVYFEL